MYRDYKIAVVIPAFNEQDLITETIENLPPEADHIYVIDDGSGDATGEIVRRYVNHRVELITHETNRGVGAAIISGYWKAVTDGFDVMVVMAGDNQMHARHLTELLAPITEGRADYTKGNRLVSLKHTSGMSPWRLLGNFLLTWLTKVSSGYWHISDPQNGYTAITRQALAKIDLAAVYPRYGYCNDVLAKLNVAGCRVVDVPIPAVYGKEITKIRYGRYITHVSMLLLRNFLWRLRQKYH